MVEQAAGAEPATARERPRPLSRVEIAMAAVSTLLAPVAGLPSEARQSFEPFLGAGSASVRWGAGVVVVLVAVAAVVVRRPRGRGRRSLVTALWVVPLVAAAAVAGMAFGAVVRVPAEGSPGGGRARAPEARELLGDRYKGLPAPHPGTPVRSRQIIRGTAPSTC